MKLENSKICIIGLGYVGLPLAVAFAEKYPVVGFDISQNRVDDLIGGVDVTQEIENWHLQSVLRLRHSNNNGFLPTTNSTELAGCNIYIITVPTPTDKHNRPVLTPMIKASETVAVHLKKGNIVIYESTVYPGVTEDEMVPVLERISGLKYNIDFFCGYSPERINPGDKEHTVKKILKVTSGSNPEVADFIDQLYKSIITAGTYKASSIKVAEAAKVIENTQRDINIAFVNELSKIFSKMGLDTQDVLEAAATKWNFLNFKPGLVGGHCISVDPYYLAQKAEELGYHPEIILAGRRLNSSMGKHVALEVIQLMIQKGLTIMDSKVLILGITFKENCPDVRNTGVIEIIKELRSFKIQVDVYDPWANKEEVKSEYGIELNDFIPKSKEYSAAILAVSHDLFRELDVRKLVGSGAIVYDVKGFFPKNIVDKRL